MKNFDLMDLILILLFLLAVYFILTRIFGHSATDLTISITLISFLGGLIYNNMNNTAKLNREFGEFKVEVRNTLERIREDISKLKK